MGGCFSLCEMKHEETEGNKNNENEEQNQEQNEGNKEKIGRTKKNKTRLPKNFKDLLPEDDDDDNFEENIHIDTEKNSDKKEEIINTDNSEKKNKEEVEKLLDEIFATKPVDKKNVNKEENGAVIK